MSSTYAFFSHFAQTWGLVYFVAIFVAVLAYALWPSRQEAVRRIGAHSAAGGLRWTTADKHAPDAARRRSGPPATNGTASTN